MPFRDKGVILLLILVIYTMHKQYIQVKGKIQRNNASTPTLGLMLSFITRWTILRIDVIYERTDSTSLFITNIMAVIYHHKCAGTVSKKGNRKSTIIDWLHHITFQFHALPNVNILGRILLLLFQGYFLCTIQYSLKDKLKSSFSCLKYNKMAS